MTIVSSTDEEMSVEELANLLNVSEIYAASLLDAGEIPFRVSGQERRVLRSNAMRFKRLADARCEAAMRELVAESEKLGLYD